MEIDGSEFHLFECQRDLFARRASVNGTGRVAQLGGRFPQTTPVSPQTRDDDEFLADADFGDKAHIEFGSETKTFRGRGGGPKHRFIQYCRKDTAVNDAAKAGVLGLRCEIGPHLAAFPAEAKMKSMRVMRAAHKTIARVRKLDLSHFMKILKRRPTR